MATTRINVNLSYGETQFSNQNSRFCLNFRFDYKHETITSHSYRNPDSFLCLIDRGLVADGNPNSTALLCNDLHSFINQCDPDLNQQLRLSLARTIAHVLKSTTTIFPLPREVRADVEIIHQVHSWIPIHHHQQSTPLDGGDLVSDETGSGASKLGLRKLMKRRFYYDGEEECSICWEKYGEGMEAIKMPCNHVFHQKCILRWLNTNASCPLCRRTI